MKKRKKIWFIILWFLIIIWLFLAWLITFKYTKTQKFLEDKYGKCIDCNWEIFNKQCYWSIPMKNNSRCCEWTFVLEISNCDDWVLY